MNESVEGLRDFIAESVRQGFKSPHEIIENAQDWMLENSGRDDLVLEIRQLTAEALSDHHAAQVGWDSSTDCDRLDSAFAALDAQGIVARQNFSCCNNCGFAEIRDEVETEMEKRQDPVDGYVFYHLQCTERAMRTGQLLLAYGCVEEDPESLVAVADKIVAELRKAGLDASWGGTDHHPIVVNGLVWRRRRNT